MRNRKSFLLFLAIFSAVFLSAQNSPSSDSLRNQRIEELKKIKPVFKLKKKSEDSIFATIYSDVNSTVSLMGFKQWAPPVQEAIYFTGHYPGKAETEFVNAKIGDVIGPYVSGNKAGIYKVMWKGMGYDYDSVEVRHILIAYKGAERALPEVTRSKAQAKKLADSLLLVIQTGDTKMTDLVLPYTDDPGSKLGNLGNYGWFGRGAGFIQAFKDAGFNNPVGATVVIETQFGYHVIQVLNKIENRFCVKALPIERIIDPDIDYLEQQDQRITLPVFPGGIIQLRKYLKDSLRYPQAEFAKHAEASVKIMFKIGADGKIYDVVNAGSDANKDFLDEAIRLVRSMPSWQPGVFKGQPKEFLLKVTIPFRVSG